MKELVTVRIDSDVLGWLRLRALKENRSLSNMIAYLLKEAMEHEED